MKKTISLLVMLAVLLTPTLAFAASPWTEVFAASPWTEKDTYAEKVTGKLEFGFKNLVGGWTEIFSRPGKYKEKEAGNVFLRIGNVFLGIGHGLLNAIVYTVGGAAHMVTFPIPLDIPLPDNGVSLE